MPESTDWEQLDRYLAGELGESDAAAVRRWLMAHPDHAQLLDRVNRELDYTKAFGDGNLADALVSWHAVQARAMKEDDRVSSGGLSTVGQRGVVGHGAAVGSHLLWRDFKGQSLRRRLWSTAAVVLGLVVTIASWHAGVFRGHTATSMMTYLTGNGERATIALPDGGTVALNVASRLDVPMDYMAGHRTIRLVGEGLFTVAHHTGNPLTVIAGGTLVRVLGTSFVVRHYATDTATTVAVQDGKVTVATKVQTARQAVEVGPRGVPHLRSSNVGLFTFAAGTLTIDGLSLPAAIMELDRWYDADIRLGDSLLATRHMRGTFGAGSLGDLEERLALMYDVRVVRDGRVLTLYPRR